jgi:hypothetical protein
LRRFIAILISAVALAMVPAGAALAQPAPEHASCMGLGSYFYAQGAGFEGVRGVRADIAHIVKDAISPVPGEYLNAFAQEKEGGSIPEPCGARIE